MNSPHLNPLVILVAAIFTHNIALVYLLGMCPMMALSRRIDTALGMGLAVLFVTAVTAPIDWIVYHKLLVPLHAEFMVLLVFIIVIASVVQFLELLMRRFLPALHAGFGPFLPLVTVNTTIFAVSIFMVLRNYSFWQEVAFSIGSGAGWALAIVLIAGIRERMLLVSDVPADMRGAGITMIIAGILALAFIGFSGMVAIQ
jgi:Na+-transporting NADH:ubiquinone oxidoreductase subunit E